MVTLDSSKVGEAFLQLAMVLLIGGVLAVLAIWIWCRVVDFSFARLMGLLRLRLSSRRRMTRSEVMRTDLEVQLDAMDDETLRAFVEARPENPHGSEILCERLRRGGDLKGYAREMMVFLSLPSDLSAEETCRRYHELADLYLNELGRPDQAIGCLQTLIARFPKHYQATLARSKLIRMEREDGTLEQPPVI